MEIREFSRNDRVRVDNCYAWDIGFRSSVTREDITIPAGAKGYALLTVDQVEEEIMRQNVFFVGTDGLGDHAGLQICDPDMYKYLFRCEDHTHHVSKESIIELLSFLRFLLKSGYMDEYLALLDDIKVYQGWELQDGEVYGKELAAAAEEKASYYEEWAEGYKVPPQTIEEAYQQVEEWREGYEAFMKSCEKVRDEV